MPAVRHHTVSAFLLERFAIETKKGRRVCMLEKATGTPTLVSPRDATVRKHFYSIDVDDGTDPAVEDALSKIESLAAPLVTRLGAGDLPMGQERLDLATFVSMCWLRTPAWREQMASVMEQVTAAMAAESYRLDPEAAQRVLANSEFEMTRDEIEAFRRKFVDDLDAGRLRMEMPKNAMIGYFLHATAETAWLLTILDWTLVRLDGGAKELIIGDTPVSLYDSSPRFPGGGVGVLSSPNAQMFLPLGPRVGLLLQPTEQQWKWARENLEEFRRMSEEERSYLIVEREGGWAEGVPTAEFAQELNLRSYAHAERFVFGSQKAVQDVRAAARSAPARLIDLAPRGGRMHFVEDDPNSPTGLRITKTFAPKRRTSARSR